VGKIKIHRFFSLLQKSFWLPWKNPLFPLEKILPTTMIIPVFLLLTFISGWPNLAENRSSACWMLLRRC